MAYGDEFLTNRLTVAGPSFTGGHPLQVPETFVPPGSADIYRGYFGMTSITGFQKGSLNVGVNLDSPLGIYGAPGTPHFFDVGTILTLNGDHRVIGRSSVTGAEFRTNVANAHILGSTAQLVGKTVNVAGTKTNVSGAEVTIEGTSNVTINGLNSATGARPTIWDNKKPFDILHPTKEGHRLRYVCLEGPSAEVYVRGKLKNSNIIELPDYWRGLVDEETIGVNLTPIGTYQELFWEKIEDYKIIIKNNASSGIHCHYIVYGERKDTSKNIPEYPGLTPMDYPGDNREYNLNNR